MEGGGEEANTALGRTLERLETFPVSKRAGDVCVCLSFCQSLLLFLVYIQADSGADSV